MSYFRGADVHPDYPLFQELGSKVTVMCGLPAAGKDTWVRTHRRDLPVVSFDDARTELGLKHGENEGKAVHWATDKARSLLRTHEPFVWNATHLSQQMRTRTLDCATPTAQKWKLSIWSARVRNYCAATVNETPH
nr:AAA family ATPase [Pectobacterium colocasium]